jgi:hypothetical protein
MRGARSFSLACTLVVAFTSRTARAQWTGASSGAALERVGYTRSLLPAFEWARGIPRSAAPIASLAIPGLGQAVLGRERFVAYVAIEGFTLLQYAKDSRESARERRRYRGLARDVSRASFGGTRPDGSWDYYEAMERFLESGEFSLSANQLVPEVDTTTYNGSRWLLARRTHWANPFVEPPRSSEEYQRALALYLEKAARPEFRWSWRNAQLQLDLYRGSIDRANDSARRARGALTLLLANHLLSAFDAFAVLRIEGDPTSRTRRVSVAIPLHH